MSLQLPPIPTCDQCGKAHEAHEPHYMTQQFRDYVWHKTGRNARPHDSYGHTGGIIRAAAIMAYAIQAKQNPCAQCQSSCIHCTDAPVGIRQKVAI